MNPIKIRNCKSGPEAEIQEAILKYLRHREWYCKETHGNMFQSGFPDLYCTHRLYGIRWIEVKNPLAYSFTNAQMSDFPMLSANGTGVWILTAATESEYLKLWGPQNWYMYLLLLNQRGCK